MKQLKWIIFVMIAFVSQAKMAKAQEENKVKLSGNLLTDQRFLLKNPNNWAWNENRLTLKLNKKIAGNSKFYSEVWLRNMGLPKAAASADLYNKGILDPYNLEVREAYVQLFGFLSKNLDIKIGRQRITWGTADKLNPTDNLNPYDMEDILDFGRHRGSDALSFDYYFNSDFSMQGVYIPFFAPANMPLGIFSTVLNPTMELPTGMVLKSYSDQMVMPKNNFAETATAGFKFKGFIGGVDFSLSYVWGRDGIPIPTHNLFIPLDTLGGTLVKNTSSFLRTHIFGADFSTNIKGVGFWGEAAAFLPENEVVMRNDFSAFYPLSPVPVYKDSIVLEKKIYTKFIVGMDYTLNNGAYLNFQYLHGFINERGSDYLNDYFFIQLEKKFFDDKLKIVPLSGGYIVSDWKDMANNYSIIYVPSISYMATDNAELKLSAAFFEGKGDNVFVGLKEYDMLMLSFKYSF